MQKHYNITVSGKVQGVFFRVSTKDKAEELGIKGYVMNQKNGAVFLEAEGEQADLNELIQWCKLGPRNSIVEKVEVEEGELKNYKSFEVKR